MLEVDYSTCPKCRGLASPLTNSVVIVYECGSCKHRYSPTLETVGDLLKDAQKYALEPLATAVEACHGAAALEACQALSRYADRIRSALIAPYVPSNDKQ